MRMEQTFGFGRTAVLLAILVAFTGCASHAQRQSAAGPPNKDPLESFNRKVFALNDSLDGWVLKPVAKTYHVITPDPVENGVGNFFANLSEVPSAFNNILQWKWKKAGANTGRFLLNSTIGLVGLFDVAKYTGLERKDGESFGQTLSHWGMKPGPYLVLPLMGSSTTTDLLAMPIDWYTDPLYYVGEESVRNSLRALGVIDTRTRLLSAEELISGDRYTFIREAFLQRREYLVKDGAVVDDFGGDFEDFDEDF